MGYTEDVAAARQAVADAKTAKAATAAKVTDAQTAVTQAQAALVAAQKADETAGSNLAEAEDHLADLLNNPPAPEPSGGMLYGYGHSNKARLEQDTKVLVMADRAYESSCPASQDDTVAKGMRPGGVPIVSFKVSDWAAAGKGSIDAQFEKYLRSITRRTIVIFAHEPENDKRSPTDFKAMGNRLLDVAKRVANPNVTMAINLMTSWINASVTKGAKSEQYIITGRTDYVLSWDGYSHKTSDTPVGRFGAALALNKKYGLRFAIAETASDVAAANWVQQITSWSELNNAMFCCYWPSQTSEVGAADYYPPASAFPTFASVALKYGGTKI